MLQELFVKIAHEECAEMLRDIRDVPALLERILSRLGYELDAYKLDLVGDNEPIISEDETNG